MLEYIRDEKTFDEIIFGRIRLKQEGDYWDFKREWYGERTDNMLHDIICMANNLADHDAYIIIGVDEENDYAPYHFDKTKRRTTQNIVDFLREKKFAGDNRPIVSVENVLMYEYDIDVIVVHNSVNTPYYLSERYQGVLANNIYSRIQDSNTPKDKSADIAYIEKLWKKRFGLDRTALEKVYIFLKNPEDWKECDYDESMKYCIFSPEYTIGYERDTDDLRTGYEYYFLNQVDYSPMWMDITIKYHQTIIQTFGGLLLDGGRLASPAPDRNGFSLSEYGSWDVSYAYMLKDSLKYRVHCFYLSEGNREQLSAHDRLMERILLFDNEIEHQMFISYAKSNWYKREQYLEKIREPYIEFGKENQRERFIKETNDVLVLKVMFEEYKSQFETNERF